MRSNIHTCLNWALVDGDCSGVIALSGLISYFFSIWPNILLVAALEICIVCLIFTSFST